MDYKTIVIISLAFCAFVSTASGLCTFNSPYLISETAPNGTILLNVSQSVGNNATFQVKDSFTPPNAKLVQELQNRFLLKNYDRYFTLENTKSLDLEEFMLSYNQDISAVTVNIGCNGHMNDIIIAVLPVNEFPPAFQKGPYNLTLPESTAVKSIVFKLKPRVKDGDVGEVQNFIFKINPYNIQDYDGAEFFSIPASSQGNISLSKALDFDDPNKRKSLRLNVSVADGYANDSKIAFTAVSIYVEDVDDQAPYFKFPNCPKPCPAPPFVATIKLADTGILAISPSPLEALDDDTLGTPLVYSIKSGNEDNLFEINPTTAVVNQKMSVNALKLSDSEFRLVIEVRKNLTSVKLFSVAILRVLVWERMSNDSYPGPPVGKSTDSSSSSDLLIPLIVLGIFLAIVLVALVVVFVLYRRKHKGMSVRPHEDKSEPQTEEEELHTEGEDNHGRIDTNEKLIFGNKTTLGIMTDEFPDTSNAKGNRLPPLPMRDSATETMDGKRKKKSRRRNKNKEPEVFDGTREYNMGLDPEFFDSTDKSRVKRSQRSKKADSAFPIQVPNDNLADQGPVYM